jgi:hypothetical protein
MSVILAVCYGLAITIAGLFHEHGDAGGCCDAPGSKGAHSHCDDGTAEHQGTPSRQPSPGQAPADGSHCAVCKFLGQQTLPVAMPAEVLAVESARVAAPPALPQCISPVPSAWHSRGPPDVA